jgi:hypothetical protein
MVHELEQQDHIPKELHLRAFPTAMGIPDGLAWPTELVSLCRVV